jgi:RNA polymerase sigma-70 factor, ECF subfamily
MADPREDVTQVLAQMRDGDKRAADRLLPLVYDEFRALARHYLAQERQNHTLQPTALVHEAYLKLVDQTRVDWQSKNHFFAVAAQAMRRILVDHARSRQRDKRGGGRARVALDEAVALSPQKDEDVIALDEALQKLADLSTRGKPRSSSFAFSAA